jgi:hypothetical protein
VTGLRRMLESEATPVERWLLDSARDDVPPANGANRLLLGLGVGASAASVAGAASLAKAAAHAAVAGPAAATTGALGVAEAAATGSVAAAASGGTTAAASSITAKAFALLGAKWLGAGVVAGAVATGALRTTVAADPSESTTTFVQPSSLSATKSGEQETRTVARRLPKVLHTWAESTQPNEQGRGAAATARADAEDPGDLGVRSVPSGSVSDALSEGPASIAQEVAVVDQARTSLRSGDVRGAMTALATHDREYGAGALGPEAGRLRCETLLVSGKRSAAALCARQYLAAHPTSPHASSMRSLVARIEGPKNPKPMQNTASFAPAAGAPVSAPPSSSASTPPAQPNVDPGTANVAAFPDG